MQRMFAKQETATDQAYETLSISISMNGGLLAHLARTARELNEKSESVEPAAAATALDAAAAKRLNVVERGAMQR